MKMKPRIAPSLLTLAAIHSLAGSASGFDFDPDIYTDSSTAKNYARSYLEGSKKDEWRLPFANEQFIVDAKDGSYDPPTSIVRVKILFPQGETAGLGTAYVAGSNKTAMTAAHVVVKKKSAGVFAYASQVMFNSISFGDAALNKECNYIVNRSYVANNSRQYDLAVLFPKDGTNLHTSPISVRANHHQHKKWLMDGTNIQLLGYPLQGLFSIYDSYYNEWLFGNLKIKSFDTQKSTYLVPACIRNSVNSGIMTPINRLSAGSIYRGALQQLAIPGIQSGPGGSGGPLLYTAPGGALYSLGTYNAHTSPTTPLTRSLISIYAADLDDHALLINTAMYKIQTQPIYQLTDSKWAGLVINRSKTLSMNLNTVAVNNTKHNFMIGHTTFKVPSFIVGNGTPAIFNTLTGVKFTVTYHNLNQNIRSISTTATKKTDNTFGNAFVNLDKIKEVSTGKIDPISYEDLMTGTFNLKIEPVFAAGATPQTVTIKEPLTISILNSIY